MIGTLGLFIFLSLIMVYGIKESARLAIFISFIEVSGLLIVIYTGLPYLGTVNYLEATDLAGIFQASTLIFFAFLGFEDIVRLSQETKKSRKDNSKSPAYCHLCYGFPVHMRGSNCRKRA